MHKTLVTSSNIRSIGYDPQSAVLEAEFTSGEVYRYFNVMSMVINIRKLVDLTFTPKTDKN